MFDHHGEPIAAQCSGFGAQGGTIFDVYQHFAESFNGTGDRHTDRGVDRHGGVDAGSLARSDGGSNTRDKAALPLAIRDSPGMEHRGDRGSAYGSSGRSGSFEFGPHSPVGDPLGSGRAQGHPACT